MLGNYAHAVNCSGDLLCIGIADRTVHLFAPLVAIFGSADGRRPRRWDGMTRAGANCDWSPFPQEMKAGVSGDRKALRVVVVGRLIDAFDEEIAFKRSGNMASTTREE
jgi:hypothetical protein